MPQTWRGTYEGNPEYVGQLRRQWGAREKLEEKYPIGQCASHPELRCFYHAPTDWHFNLDTNRLNVWANAIVSYN
jgi:hypothetical protein